MAYISNVQDDPEKSTYLIGFTKGLNTIQNRFLIDNKNLVESTNTEYVVDGVQRRPGSSREFDDGGGSKVYGSTPYYRKSSSVRKFLRIAKQRLQYLNGDAWTDIGSTAFANADTNFIQARDLIFIYNGSDPLRKYDNSSVNSYTAITTPTNLTVTPTFKDTMSVTITSSSTTATATSASAHGLKTGDRVAISGAAQNEYNGTYVITIKSATTFTYTFAGSATSPATGTITYTSMGAETVSYRIEAFNSTGTSAACTAATATTSLKANELSTTKYNALTWTAVSNALGYNVYGRTATGFGEAYMATVYTNSYNDVGSDTPNYARKPSTDNTSGGVIAKGGCFTLGRQFVFGVTEGSTYHPCRIAYSGTLEYVDCFAATDFGGGWVDVSANDGGEIVAVAPYQSGVVIFKTNGIFKLYFTSDGLPAINEITRSHGGTSHRAVQQVENDILYVGQKENRIAVFTLGQQENYSGDQLRTNEVSVFIKPNLMNAARNYLSNIASFYFDDKFGFAYTIEGETENSVGYVIDTKFGAWCKWTGSPMAMNHYTIYDDGTNVHLYGGSNATGYMWELFKDARNDNGVAFTTTIQTKHYNFDMFNVEKIFRNPCFWFKYISGGEITCGVYSDGTTYQGSAVFSSGNVSYGTGDLAGTFLAGDFYGTVSTSTTENADIPMEISKMFIGRSIGFSLVDDAKNSNWLLMGVNLNYSPLLGKPLQEQFRVQVTV